MASAPLEKIQVRSIAEVYLLDDQQKPAKRICGRALKGNMARHCTAYAGASTQHFGVGFCKTHRGTIEQEKLFTLEYLHHHGALTLAAVMDGVEVADEDMYDLRGEVAMLKGMADLTVGRYGLAAVTGALGTSSDSSALLGIVKSLVQTKKAYADIKASRLSFSQRQIEEYVKEVLRIVKEEAGGAVVDRISARFDEVMVKFGRGSALPLQITQKEDTDE